MNFLLSALIIIVILLPGATILKAYYTSFIEKKSSFELPTSELFIKGLAWSFLIHTIAICTLRLFHIEVNLNFIYQIINGKDIDISNHEFGKSFRYFSLYTFTLIVIAWGITKQFKKFIRSRNYDINVHSLRNTNYWYHIFSARYLEGAYIPGRQIDTDIIFMDILVKCGIIYSGFLKDFNYSSHKDELENIVLQSVEKRKHDSENIGKKDKSKTKNKKTIAAPSIPGHVFVIPMTDILNINISYINLNVKSHALKNNIAN